jgi:glutamate-1-semialdehyde 2,1-aminomutase
MIDKKYSLHHPGYQHGTYPEIVSATGSLLISSDGRGFFDAGLGAGSQILGHTHSSVVAAVEQQITKGSVYLHNNKNIHSLCEELLEILPRGHSNFVFCSSGSEATQRALRLARAATGRERIGYFHGGWHGMNEWTLAQDGNRFGNAEKKIPDGIPKQILKDSLVLPYNVNEAFEILESVPNNLAAVIVEPVQGSNPREDILPFLERLQAYCRKTGTLMIFDEIITGFRLDIGGASKKWNLSPDIITYGKVLGGGMPIGLMTCTDEVAATTFYDQSKRVLTGGTFSANPLIAAVSLAVVRTLKNQNYNTIDDLSELMRSKLNSYFINKNLPFSMIGIASISRLAFTNHFFRNRRERDALESSLMVQEIFRKSLMDQDVLWPTNGIVFTGFCHSEEQITELSEKVINAVNSTLETV